MFALEKIEKAADEVLRVRCISLQQPRARRGICSTDPTLYLQDQFDNIYWYFLDQHDARFRIAFDNLPRWEAHAALGYVNYVRLCDSFRGFPEGEVVFGDREAARKMAECYQAASDLMPDDFYLKRIGTSLPPAFPE